MITLEKLFKREELYNITDVQKFLAYCDKQGYYYEFLDENSVCGYGDILVSVLDKTFKLVEVCVNCYQSKYKVEEC